MLAKWGAVQTINKHIQALKYYELVTENGDYKNFDADRAIKLKEYIKDKDYSLSTLNNVTHCLKKFFLWLAQENGYKQAINFSDIQYLSVKRQEKTMAQPTQYHERPTLQQCKKALFNMPNNTPIERRNKACLAILISTGFRIDTLISLKIDNYNNQDALFHIKPNGQGVRTKFSKELTVKLFPVGSDIHAIINEWVKYCKNELMFNNNSPLIPASVVRLNDDLFFENGHFAPQAPHLKTGNMVNKAIATAFQNVKMPPYTCHDFRRMLADYGQEICKDEKERKAWSQNLGHSDISTTFAIYASPMSVYEQKDIMQSLNDNENKFAHSLEENL